MTDPTTLPQQELATSQEQLSKIQSIKFNTLKNSNFSKELKRVLLEASFPALSVFFTAIGTPQVFAMDNLQQEPKQTQRVTPINYPSVESKKEDELDDDQPDEEFEAEIPDSVHLEDNPGSFFSFPKGTHIDEILDFQLARHLMPELKLENPQNIHQEEVIKAIEKYKQENQNLWQSLQKEYSAATKITNPNLQLDEEGKLTNDTKLSLAPLKDMLAKIQLKTIGGPSESIDEFYQKHITDPKGIKV